MKQYHYLIVLLLGLGLLSCSGNGMLVPDKEKDSSSLLTKTTAPASTDSKEIDFVVKEADVLNYISRHNDSPRIVSLDPVKRDGEDLLYVVNYADGWSLFSADKHLPPVVAENKTGTFHLESLDNPGVLFWMDEMMDLTSRLRQETGKTTANEYTDLWEGCPTTQKETGDPSKSQYTWTKVLVSSTQEMVDTLTVGPFLQTAWGQLDPWNVKLVNNGVTYPTGCSAVAFAQLLYYFHDSIGIPSGLYHGITVSSWTNHTLYYTSNLTRTDYTVSSSRWAQMVKKYSDYDSSVPSSVTGASYVADLMTDVGNRLNMKYNANKSNAGITDAQTGLAYYGLTGNRATFSDTLAVSEILQNNKPFYIQGFLPPVNGDGHAWVFDGLKQHRDKTTNTYEWHMGYIPGSIPEGEPATQEEALAAALEAGYDKPEDLMVTQELLYSELHREYHMNWGWNGLADGYYSEPYVTINGVTYSFSRDRQILYNIRSNAN